MRPRVLKGKSLARSRMITHKKWKARWLSCILRILHGARERGESRNASWGTKVEVCAPHCCRVDRMRFTWAGHVARGHGVLVRASVLCDVRRSSHSRESDNCQHNACRVLSSVVCPRVLYRGRHVRIRHVDVRRGGSLLTFHSHHYTDCHFQLHPSKER